MSEPSFFLSLEAVEAKIGYRFHDRKWLKLALVHRSFWNEHKNEVEGHNERLEFLGDAVLGLIVSEHLFRLHPDISEGILSDYRAQLVGASPCALYLRKLDLQESLLLGRGEERRAPSKGRETILADFFEAIVGAIYLDGGIEKVKSFFFSHFREEIDSKLERPLRNWKAELQDFVQKQYRVPPRYEVVEERGPAHARTFTVALFVQEEKWAQGEGESKKEAETAAARAALERLSGGGRHG